MSDKKKIDFYNQAINNYVDMSLNDPTSIIAKEHGLMGLTRILICLNELGIKDGDCVITALPDHTYTRNKTRWSAGFAYGTIISIKSPNTPFIPLDVLPNCCGVIVAEIDDISNDINDLKAKINKLIESYNEIDASDFKRGNHFIGIYKANNRYYILLHCSFIYAKEIRNSYSHHKCDVNTTNILGQSFKFVYGDSAIKYYKEFVEENSLSIRYRELIIKDLFPSAQILFNQTHQGFYDINNILLGAYASSKPFVCPVMLTPEHDLSMIKVEKHIKVFEHNIYCSPHGGGYAIQGVTDIKNNNDFPHNSSSFLLEYSNGALMLTDNLIDLPFYYRSNTDICWCEKYEMGQIINKLQPIYNFKI